MELRPTEVHFGTAAESLGIAPPALTQQIRASSANSAPNLGMED
ncbi:LysR family transcriptional regulator [Bradyrhizobium sp. AUGA SZCCT0182]|nr:LysR family transcriptional regulator [Bradyrhizobium sp. AUGA SZCCT0182]MBR1235940.1 LysR family transcriptional regulator [Bradyrhizobium sp. AUGA SZCCT0182]